MSNFRFSVPSDIPWRLIANSTDMMDLGFCDQRFPGAWRSSIALSIFEPRLEDLPPTMCDKRLTYLKVCCSITGAQLESTAEANGTDLADMVPTERLQEILSEYLACYGVLLNVAVHPLHDERRRGMDDYPRIVDFEPKRRDLYQAATENGEVLTASVNRLRLDNTFTHTESVETGLSLTAGMRRHAGIDIEAAEAGAEASAQGSLSRTWGETSQDVRTTARDAQQEERERFATTTQLNQMYNLLSGYHLGSNRSVFLMLPRPHSKQPSEHRTFAQGLRVIEGVQDFFLVVQRPRESEGLRVEVQLETGHFPEGTVIEEPQTEWERTSQTVRVRETVHSKGQFRSRDTRRFDHAFNGFEVDGWRFDPTRGDPGRNGVEQVVESADNADGTTGGRGVFTSMPAMEDYEYGASSPDSVFVKALLRGYVEEDTRFRRSYRVHLRRERRTTASERADAGRLIVLGRSLCASYRASDHCMEAPREDDDIPIVEDGARDPLPDAESRMGVLDELDLKISKVATTKGNASIAAHLTAEAVGRALASSWKMPSRRPLGEATLLDTDYMRDRLLDLVPESRKSRPAAEEVGIPAEVSKALGPRITIGEVLAMRLPELAVRTGRPVAEVARLRRRLMFSGSVDGVKDDRPEDEGPQGLGS